MFIVIEGIDLIGKTTQHGRLVQHLRGLGREVAAYSFPRYASPTGEVISDHLRGLVSLVEHKGLQVWPPRSPHDSLVFQCLQLCDRYAVSQEISAHLRAGRDVVACRWWQSALAYGVESGLDAGWLLATTACLPRADVNILLDLDPRDARRRPGETPDRLEDSVARQQRIRQRYLEMWRGAFYTARESGYWAQVHAGGRVEEIHDRILGVMASARALNPQVILTDGSSGRTW